jgi:hypothetical protein
VVQESSGSLWALTSFFSPYPRSDPNCRWEAFLSDSRPASLERATRKGISTVRKLIEAGQRNGLAEDTVHSNAVLIVRRRLIIADGTYVLQITIRCYGVPNRRTSTDIHDLPVFFHFEMTWGLQCGQIC